MTIRIIIAAAAAFALAGCGSTKGLNVSWWATMSYNADAKTEVKAEHKTSPVPTAPAPAAAAPASAASGAK